MCQVMTHEGNKYEKEVIRRVDGRKDTPTQQKRQTRDKRKQGACARGARGVRVWYACVVCDVGA